MVSRRNPGGGDNPRPRSLMISNIQSEQDIIGVTQVAESAVVGVRGIVIGKLLLALPKGFCLLPLPCFLSAKRFVLYSYICLVLLAAFAFGVLWHEHRFHERVQLVEIDIGENWTEDTSLWTSTERCMITPLFQISSRQQCCDEAKKAAIMNLLAKRVHHDRVIE